MGVTISRDGQDWRVDAEQVIDAPLDRVFPFFSDAHNLERITPDLLRFRVLTPDPITMRVGALIDYRLRVRGFPVRWRTQIIEWDPPHSFVDVQLKGPYELWHHTHTFESLGERTRCVDVVRYRPAGGLLAGLVNRIFVQRDVEAIFRYRMRALDEIFALETGRSTTPTSSVA